MKVKEWAITLKNRRTDVENILQLLDAKLNPRGKKGGARVQEKETAGRVAQSLRDVPFGKKI